MIKAMVFDFDGLIFDSETPTYLAMQELFREHDAELTIEMWGKAIGTQHGFDPHAHIEQVSGRKIDKTAFRDRHRELYLNEVANVQVREGVADYLRKGQELGLRIGLASSSNRQWIEDHLQKFGLRDYFETLCTSDDVEEVKPNPALYLLACERLGVQPQESVAFEDSPNGSLAAKRAGMYCVTFPNTVTSLLTFGEVDLTFKSMAAIPLDQLIERLTQR